MNKDYTKGGAITATIAIGIVYLVAYDLTGLELFLLSYLAGIIGYFAYLAYRKQEVYESKWDGNEILAGFFGVVLPLFFISLIVIFVRSVL